MPWCQTHTDIENESESVHPSISSAQASDASCSGEKKLFKTVTIEKSIWGKRFLPTLSYLLFSFLKSWITRALLLLIFFFPFHFAELQIKKYFESLNSTGWFPQLPPILTVLNVPICDWTTCCSPHLRFFTQKLQVETRPGPGTKSYMKLLHIKSLTIPRPSVLILANALLVCLYPFLPSCISWGILLFCERMLLKLPGCSQLYPLHDPFGHITGE